MELKIIETKLKDLVPYENNPRFIENAVGQVMESIEQVGYVSPIIVDEDMVILAGHTRFNALLRLGIEDVQVVQAIGQTEEQKRKFRLLDNKIGELAIWDLDKLKEEIKGLDFGDFQGFQMVPEKVEEITDLTVDEEPEEQELKCPKCGALIIEVEDEA